MTALPVTTPNASSLAALTRAAIFPRLRYVGSKYYTDQGRRVDAAGPEEPR